MAVEEHRRIALHRAATESWGEENADTLVDLVTPAGHEMATKADIQTVLSALEAMDERWETRFVAMEARLDAIDGRLDAIDGRLDAIDGRLDAIDGRLDAIDGRWEERLSAMEVRWDERVSAMEVRWDERVSAMNERWASQLEATEHRLTATFERGLRDAVTTQTRVLVISVLVAVVTMGGLTVAVAA